MFCYRVKCNLFRNLQSTCISGQNMLTREAKCRRFRVLQLRLMSSLNRNDDESNCKGEHKMDMRRHLEKEHEMMKIRGYRVPEKLTEEQWAFIEKLETKSQRRKNYQFLANAEDKYRLDKEKRLQKRLQSEESKQKFLEIQENNKHITYGLTHCSLSPAIRKYTINKWRHQNVFQAMQYGPKIVYDCSYGAYMTPVESRMTGTQLKRCISANREHREPFDVHICNVSWNEIAMKTLKQHIPQIGTPSYPVECHEKCMVDVFSRNRLVYLTPHCDDELEMFNGDDIYIIGAMVDKSSCIELSLAKATELGLRTARLPLDKYFVFDGSKRLHLDHVHNILLDLRLTDDWKYALRHIPGKKRKGTRPELKLSIK